MSRRATRQLSRKRLWLQRHAGCRVTRRGGPHKTASYCRHSVLVASRDATTSTKTLVAAVACCLPRRATRRTTQKGFLLQAQRSCRVARRDNFHENDCGCCGMLSAASRDAADHTKQLLAAGTAFLSRRATRQLTRKRFWLQWGTGCRVARRGGPHKTASYCRHSILVASRDATTSTKTLVTAVACWLLRRATRRTTQNSFSLQAQRSCRVARRDNFH